VRTDSSLKMYEIPVFSVGGGIFNLDDQKVGIIVIHLAFDNFGRNVALPVSGLEVDELADPGNPLFLSRLVDFVADFSLVIPGDVYAGLLAAVVQQTLPGLNEAGAAVGAVVDDEVLVSGVLLEVVSLLEEVLAFGLGSRQQAGRESSVIRVLLVDDAVLGVVVGHLEAVEEDPRRVAVGGQGHLASGIRNLPLHVVVFDVEDKLDSSDVALELAKYRLLVEL
jgi:hypothetical protein